MIGSVETGHVPAHRVAFDRHVTVDCGDSSSTRDVIEMVVEWEVQKHVACAIQFL